MDQYTERGYPFEVPEYNAADSAEAAEAEQRSNELEQRQNELIDAIFGRDYQVENYDPALLVAQSVPTISPGKGRTQFIENEQDLKCEVGKRPIYPKRGIPFYYYSQKASDVCTTNAPNLYLTWDNQKYKYCCNPEPDSNEKILKHIKDNIFIMVTTVSIDRKSTESLTQAVKKYLFYFSRLHSAEETEAERRRMSELIRLFTVNLTLSGEPKSLRMERDVRLTKDEANSMPEWMGGMRRKSLRRKKQQKKSKMNRRNNFKQ